MIHWIGVLASCLPTGSYHTTLILRLLPLLLDILHTPTVSHTLFALQPTTTSPFETLWASFSLHFSLVRLSSKKHRIPSDFRCIYVNLGALIIFIRRLEGSAGYDERVVILAFFFTTLLELDLDNITSLAAAIFVGCRILYYLAWGVRVGEGEGY